MEIWGKSLPAWELLSDHLTDVRSAGARLLTPARLGAFERLGVSAARARELVASAAWLHDWGKATEQWQNDIKASKKRLPQHALSSLLACRWVFNQKLESLPPEELALCLAVLAHHGQMHAGSFHADAEMFRRQQVSPYLEHWRELARELPFAVAPGKLSVPFDAAKICRMLENVKTRVPDLARASTFRGLYCLLLSILVEADHAASGHYPPFHWPVFMPRIPGQITPFQETVHTQPGEMLCAMAGCGAGKTAAALLRAARLADEQRVDRIVLCLPTRFTSNSLLRDMSDAAKYLYPQAIVGLVHSEALMVLRERFEDNDERDFPAPPNSPEEIHGRSVRYEQAITISTVDHLLMSLYHGYRFSDRAFGNLLSSLVVFDEIHAYDATTLSAIRDGMQMLQKHGVPVVLMSATLPSSRRNFLGAQPASTCIENANAFRPFIARKLPEPLTCGRGIAAQATETARKYLRDSTQLKLAVYVNQVERAKTLARATCDYWHEKQVFCYHSELAPRDRVALEDKIIRAFREDQPICLIATQAAELSLDISAERMLTELAAADILVQRAGRLNRRGAEPHARDHKRLPDEFEFSLFVAPTWRDEDTEAERAGAALPYVDLKKPESGLQMLERTWNHAPWDEVFDFDKGIAWCETALPDEPIYNDGGLRAACWTDGAFGKKPQENFSGDNNPDGVTLRDIDDAMRTVLPPQYYQELCNLHEGRNLMRQEIAQYEVPLRSKKFWALQKMTTPATLPIKVRDGAFKWKIVELPIHILNIKYDAMRGGFDFGALSNKNLAHEQTGEMI